MNLCSPVAYPSSLGLSLTWPERLWYQEIVPPPTDIRQASQLSDDKRFGSSMKSVQEGVHAYAELERQCGRL